VCTACIRRWQARSALNCNIRQADDRSGSGFGKTKLEPLLNYVRKLTEGPSRMTECDAAAVYAAGWSDEALFHAVAICAYFNQMNRLVEGTGIIGSASLLASSKPSRRQRLHWIAAQRSSLRKSRSRRVPFQGRCPAQPAWT
jgi:hypothetical protein